MSGQPAPKVAIPPDKADHYELCRAYFTDGTVGVSHGVGLMTLINQGMKAWLLEEVETKIRELQRHTTSQDKYDANNLVVIMASALGGVVSGW